MVLRNDSDFLMRVVVNTHAIRLAYGAFRQLGSEGIRRHDADPVAGRLLTGVLSSAALMSVLLDAGEKFSIRIDYNGPATGLLADVTADGAVRGFIRNPHVMSSADSIENACGDGGATVAVTRSRDGKILNSGQVRSAFILPSSALGYFLSASDQTETEIRCDVTLQPDVASPVRFADGVLLQALPGCDLKNFDRMRNQLLCAEAGAILADRSIEPEVRLRNLLQWVCESPTPVEAAIFPVDAARFHCHCSEKYMRGTTLQMLGEEDFARLLAENPDPVIRCQFCGREYHLTRDGF